VKFCPHCGSELPFKTAGFCSDCGKSLHDGISNSHLNDSNSIGVSNTNGDVIGAGISGKGNIIGKEVSYSIQGPVLNFNISGSISNELMEQLKEIIAASIPTPSDITVRKEQITDTDSEPEMQYVVGQEEGYENPITTILREVKRIEDKAGTQIQEIRVGDLEISRANLALKEYVAKITELFFEGDYIKAIKECDEALKIDPNHITILDIKGLAHSNMGSDLEAIESYNRAIDLNPNYINALWHKGLSLSKIGKRQEAIEYYDKVLKIDPDNAYALHSKQFALEKLEKDRIKKE
jgi:tetratricopeptide (TPR) repeat protein